MGVELEQKRQVLKNLNNQEPIMTDNYLDVN